MDDGYLKFDAGYYLQDHSWVRVVMKPPVKETLLALKDKDEFDIYLNLCEGYDEWYYTGLDVVRALEELNVPFTGSNSGFYNPTREQMQSAAESVGVRFARGGNVSTVDEAEALAEDLKYPLMVKHPNSYGSVGMTRKSRVENIQELRQQVRRLCKRFESARVEEFIEGREFTAFVVDNPDDLSDPFVYPPAELIMPPGEKFLHKYVKWKKYVYLKRVEDDDLALRLKEMSRRLYGALHGVGYARCDIRMNADGELFMLEINPNNGILYEPKDLGPADVMMEYDAAGHDGFLDRIFRSALMRQRERVVVVK
jgi:D-alanine-D-alanine ligase